MIGQKTEYEGTDHLITELPAENAFDRVINETALLFHRLRIVADQVHKQGEMSGGLRSVLRSLNKQGPHTVPQMARTRAVSRQHIQILVNQLLEAGYVEQIPNPAHRRSPLIGLTIEGRSVVEEMNRREEKLLGLIDLGIPDAKMTEAAKILRDLRSVFESDKWDALVEEIS